MTNPVREHTMRNHPIPQPLISSCHPDITMSEAILDFSRYAPEEPLMIRIVGSRGQACSHRRGYTLVEVMVALGLSVLTMWLLAEAFRIGLEMIGQARAQANLMTQLHAVGDIFHRDLVVAHPFLPDDNRPNRGLRLSDQRLDLLTATGQGWTPPPGGFFHIISPDSDALPDPDREGLKIYTATNHALHFTAILPENDRNPFCAFGPAGIRPIESRAAEIAYFLVNTGGVTGPDGNPLYQLVRRQRLVALDDTYRSSLWVPPGGVVPVNYTSLIAGDFTTGPWTLKQIRHPSRRLPLNPVNVPPDPLSASPPLVLPVNDRAYGMDILLSNVLSFEVRVDWDPNPNGTLYSSNPPRPFPVNTEYPYDNLTANAGRNPALPATFDTWHDEQDWQRAFATLPLAIRVRGIQVSVRVFDPKTRAVRQNTWRFAL